MANGGKEGGMAPSPEGYARPYSSSIDEAVRTETERKIEAALQWEDVEGDIHTPVFQVLSMNAGHAVESMLSGEPYVVHRANEDNNVSSIVLRLSGGQNSVLLTGDAEKPTWAHIIATQKLLEIRSIERDLKTDYVLLSHHGSGSNGATSREFLELFQPKSCFLSVGRHMRYHHPAQATIDSVLSLQSLFHTNSHSVSYFSKKDQKDTHKHKRRHTRRALFSTLNSGHIHLDLNTDTVLTSQVKKDTYTEEEDLSGGGGGGGIASVLKFEPDYSKVYILPKTKMQEAIKEIVGGLLTPKTNITLWRKTQSGKNKMTQLDHYAQSHGDEDPDVQLHLLLDEAENRLYFLEEIDTDEEEEAERGEKSPPPAESGSGGGDGSQVSVESKTE